MSVIADGLGKLGKRPHCQWKGPWPSSNNKAAQWENNDGHLKTEVRWNKKRTKPLSFFFPQRRITSSLTVVSPHQQVVYWSSLWKKIMMTTLKCEELIKFSLPGASFDAVLQATAAETPITDSVPDCLKGRNKETKRERKRGKTVNIYKCQNLQNSLPHLSYNLLTIDRSFLLIHNLLMEKCQNKQHAL